MSDSWTVASQNVGHMAGAATQFTNNFVSAVNNDRAWRLNKWNQKMYKEAVARDEARYNTMLDREDTAVRRRVADLTAAGLHPALAAGDGASSGTMSSPMPSPLEAPQMAKFQHQMNVSQDRAQLYMTQAQIKLIEAQARKTNVEADEYQANVESRRNLEGLRGDHLKAQTRREDLYYEYMPDLHENDRARGKYLLSQLDTLEYNLQESKDRGLRTNETNQWVQLIEYLGNIFDKLINSVEKGSRPETNVPQKGDLASHARYYYDFYLPAMKRLNRTPMSWDEWKWLSGFDD